ncbi:hypothetical protein BH10PSE9_BH10PSE9_26150 [soil metagenome]
MARSVRTQREAAFVPVKRGTVMRPAIRLTAAQRAYLMQGLEQPGGKLPLFDVHGREIDRKTVESCLSKGWAEPWFANPMKPDWLVCKLTAAGYSVLGKVPTAAAPLRDRLADRR